MIHWLFWPSLILLMISLVLKGFASWANELEYEP